MQREVYLAQEEQHLACAAQLAQLIAQGVVYLHGDLGSGKTTFTRGWLHSLGHQGAVKSPTYTLVEPYNLNNHEIYHFDLYRLASPEELEYLGVEDYFHATSLCLIEWPEQGAGFLPAPDFSLNFSYHNSGRLLTITAHHAAAQQLLAQLDLSAYPIKS